MSGVRFSQVAQVDWNIMQPDFNYNLWEDTYDPQFIDISKKSRVPEKWLVAKRIDQKYKDSIIKPVNEYLEYMAFAPKLISIVGNTVTLQYQIFADIYLRRNRDGSYYHSERPWLRQYYQTKQDWDSGDVKVTQAFKTFTFWTVDADIIARVYEPENSIFEVPESTLSFYSIGPNVDYIAPQFVSFKIKLTGDHMKDNGRYGEIYRGSPIFNIEFDASDIMVERVRKFYEEQENK